MATSTATTPVLCRTIDRPMAEVDKEIRDALKKHGFGILTEIDVKATLESKLEGVQVRPYVILGACNPKLAHAALTADARTGGFLPCGVAVYEEDAPGRTTVCIQDPALIAEAFGPELEPMASEARRLLEQALTEL